MGNTLHFVHVVKLESEWLFTPIVLEKPITNQSLNRFKECEINERPREKLNFDS